MSRELITIQEAESRGLASRSTIMRAIRCGALTTKRDKRNRHLIDPEDLRRVRDEKSTRYIYSNMVDDAVSLQGKLTDKQIATVVAILTQNQR